MKKLARLTTATLLLIFALSVTSFGWSDTGHMALLRIAMRRAPWPGNGSLWQALDWQTF